MKKKKSEVKVEEFEFKDLAGQSADLLQVNKEKIKDFKFENFTNGSSDINAEMLKIERELSKKSGFEVLPQVMEYRGILKQEHEERENRINDEVQKKIDEIQSQAYQVGYEEGLKAGLKEASDRTRVDAEQKIEVLSSSIVSILKSKNEILDIQKKEFLQLVRSLTKWIVLKELEHDDEYLLRLFEKLITESQAKTNVCVKVSEEDFNKMEEILVILQEKLATMSNVRVEINPEITHNSMILESDNGLIVATLEQQMKSLDGLFKPLIEGQS